MLKQATHCNNCYAPLKLQFRISQNNKCMENRKNKAVHYTLKYQLESRTNNWKGQFKEETR